MILDGGCFCGALRYEVEAGPLHVVHCHCTMCRRVSGAAFVTWATFPADALRWTQGQPKILSSSAKAERGFCGDCGTPLTFRYLDQPEEIDVAAASLDQPEAVSPDCHLWTENQLSWVSLADDLPRHPRTRHED